MAWFAASVITGYVPTLRTVADLQIEETVYLIEAQSRADALRIAEGFGRSQAAADSELSIDGVPGKRIYGGVRKIIETQNFDGEPNGRPAHACELSYSMFLVKDQSEMLKLASGEEVMMTYLE